MKIEIEVGMPIEFVEKPITDVLLNKFCKEYKKDKNFTIELNKQQLAELWLSRITPICCPDMPTQHNGVPIINNLTIEEINKLKNIINDRYKMCKLEHEREWVEICKPWHYKISKKICIYFINLLKCLVMIPIAIICLLIFGIIGFEIEQAIVNKGIK